LSWNWLAPGPGHPPRAPAGVYSALPSPLAAFAADIRYACSLYQAACNKHNSLFAQEYVDKCETKLGEGQAAAERALGWGTVCGVLLCHTLLSGKHQYCLP
jgi:hypothetical protein